MKKLVITGATSFIGRNVISRAKNWDITAIVRRGNKSLLPAQNLEIIELNMDEYGKLGEYIPVADCLINLAWNGTRGSERMDKEMQQNNIEHTLAGIKSMLNAGCKKVILAGSQAEYGPHTEQITEESECIPNTEYGKAKLELYQETKKLCAGQIQCIEPRFFSLYGAKDFAGTMIIDIIGKMLKGEPCDLTQGIQMWDFLHIDDAVEALLLLCESDTAEGVFNFGSGDCRQLRAFVEEMAKVTETKSSLNFGAVAYPATGMVSIWPDITKLKTELKWQPKVSFEKGIKAIAEELVKCQNR